MFRWKGSTGGWIVSCVGVAAILVLGGALATGAGGKTPPTIDDLDGTAWEVTLSGTEIDAQTGVEEKFKAEGTWTITKLTALTVGVHQDIGGGVLNFRAIYQNGILWLGAASDPELAEQALVGVLHVTGNPGKMKVSGSYITYVVFDITVGKLKAKQL